MKTVFSLKHSLQNGGVELYVNKLVPCHERPARADAVLARVQEVDLGPVITPGDFGLEPIRAVHAPDYVAFLQAAWEDWLAAGGEGEALPCCTPMRDMGTRIPASIYGRIAHYSFDATAPLTAGTWEAAHASAQVALTGADLIATGERSAFSLCRPPGHHASKSYYAGYCFLNNAAIAAQALRDRGFARVAVLDVDYHHGNGTQSIFYDRDDVFFASIHGDPDYDYPFFLGFAEERGTGAGEGCNLNLPLPHGTDGPAWFRTLDRALEAIAAFGADALVVSLGVDTFEGDPITNFGLKTDEYLEMGARLGAAGLPTLMVMEGGYNVDAIGVNVCNVLTGFAERAGI